MAQKTLFIVTFKDATEWQECPPSLIERLRGMADKVDFVGSYGTIADDDVLYGIATDINRALRGDKDSVVFGCLADDLSRICSLLDTRKCTTRKFTFRQVRMLLGV
jgi:hypothetical protein